MDSFRDATASLIRRVLKDARELALLTAYFYVVFVTVVFYKATVLHSYGVRYVVWGTALFKAILIAKFMLVGRAIKIGEGSYEAPLIKPILHKVSAFLFLLLALTSIEEVVTGLVHHRSISATFHGLGGSRMGETIAEVLILLLVLVPFVAVDVFGEALGKGRLQSMLFKGGAPQFATSNGNAFPDRHR